LHAFLDGIALGLVIMKDSSTHSISQESIEYIYCLKNLQIIHSMTIIPLSQRKYDWFFIIMFSLFASTSFMWDAIMGLGLDISEQSTYPLARILYHSYAIPIDPLVAKNPLWFQSMCFISAFVWGPFYLCLVYAFIKGYNGIRLPALLYSGALTYGMVVIFIEEFFGEVPLTNVALFLAFNLPYKILPILLAIRMRKVNPFCI